MAAIEPENEQPKRRGKVALPGMERRRASRAEGVSAKAWMQASGPRQRSWTAWGAMAKATAHRCKRDMAWSEDAGRETQAGSGRRHGCRHRTKATVLDCGLGLQSWTASEAMAKATVLGLTQWFDCNPLGCRPSQAESWLTIAGQSGVGRSINFGAVLFDSGSHNNQGRFTWSLGVNVPCWSFLGEPTNVKVSPLPALGRKIHATTIGTRLIS